MELNEAVRRILRGHRLLVVVCILLGLGAGWLVHGTEAKFCHSGMVSEEFPLTISTHDCHTYSASARLQLDLESPRSLAESAAIADTGRAIATSPGHVATALDKAAAQRDPFFVARQAVKLNAVGSSSILQLTVTDRDRDTAATLANLLAADVVRTRTDNSRALLQKAVADLDARLAELTRRIGELEARLGSLEPRAGQSGAGEITNALSAQRTALSSERTAVESQRQTLVTTDALRPKAAIVDPAQVPRRSDRSRRLANLGFGLLLGLVIGIGGATFLEIFRPTIVGGDAVARALGVPRLGRLAGTHLNGNLRDVNQVRTHLRLAANAARVDTIELLPVDPSMDVHTLAAHLAGAPNGGGAQPSPAVHAFGPSSHPSSDTAAPGLVVVAPSTLKKARLDWLGDVRTITGWRTLGVVTYEQPPWWKRLWLTASPAGRRKGRGIVP
jgi:capsular polysaccharide biosynthesis protein